MINHSTEVMVVGIFQVVQFGGVDVYKKTWRFLFGIWLPGATGLIPVGQIT
jgi:hypothetical protein